MKCESCGFKEKDYQEAMKFYSEEKRRNGSLSKELMQSVKREESLTELIESIKELLRRGD